MKLKKIASLMLAGVMAVSMLTACGGNTDGNGNNNGSNGGETTPSVNYTSTVLAETNKSTQAKLSASSNTKLDKTVETVAKNFTISADAKTFAIMPANWNQVVAAEEIMTGNDVNYSADAFNWDFSTSEVNSTTTYYTLGYVNRAMTDEYITEQVAKFLDSLAENMVDDEKVVQVSGNDCTFDYTVSVAKADCLAGDDASRASDKVVIGIAITTTVSKVEYAK